MKRDYTSIATDKAIKTLDTLLNSAENNLVNEYRDSMTELGSLLAESILYKIRQGEKSLVVATAEDADFLQKGVIDTLNSSGLETKMAIYWNNHYQSSSKISVAPIVHKFIENDFECASNLIIVKSIISGSCVVRTNIIETIHEMKDLHNIFILAPVSYKDSEEKLRSEFPEDISNKFVFCSFAIDDERTQDGTVIPGIGGQVYKLLGLDDQPVKTGYIPKALDRFIKI